MDREQDGGASCGPGSREPSPSGAVSAAIGFDPSRMMLAGCCRRCTEAAIEKGGDGPFDFRLQRMFLCAICGNKRCPHGSDHRFACTGSNVSGQAGSDYGSPMLDESGLAELLDALAREHGSLSAWAVMKGIHLEIVLSVARGARRPAKTLLKALGLRRVVAYAPILSDSDGSPEGRDAEERLDGAAATARAARHRPSDGPTPIEKEG